VGTERLRPPNKAPLPLGGGGLRPPLPREFYDRDVVAVARDLLGHILVRVARNGLAVGRIVEVEAYLAQGDPACHAARGRTRKNAAMFGPPGRAYVYSIHSRWCLNVVTEPAGIASAVLIRAVEPLAGIPLMTRRRMRRHGRPVEVRDLARGPARLCEALAVERGLDGWDLTRGTRLWITPGPPVEAASVSTSRRIGVTSGHDLPLRFYVLDSPFVSRP
jgi:DNA-3-methyladenine glycosylase